MQQHDPSKPLAHANAPRQTIKVIDEASLVPVWESSEEHKDLREAPAKQ